MSAKSRKQKSIAPVPWWWLALGAALAIAVTGAFWYPVLSGRAHFKMPAELGPRSRQHHHDHPASPRPSL
jgi:hypothetical protein